MILHVKKNPSPGTLATCIQVEDGAPAPNGWEAMIVAEFEAWRSAEISNGWLPPAPVLGAVPDEVGRGQLHAAFVALGWITPTSPGAVVSEVNTWITGMIDTVIADEGERTIAHALWGTAGTFKRAHPFMALVAAMAGKTSEDIDQLFRTAANF